MSAGLAHLKAAKAAVPDDEELRRRVEVGELPALYVFLVRWDELRDRAKATGTTWPLEEEIRLVYDRLLTVMQDNGIIQFSERNARDWFPSVRMFSQEPSGRTVLANRICASDVGLCEVV